MNVIIFTGPTLPVDLARNELQATYLPPAAQGDVYRAAHTMPAAIGIIDGVFDQVPSVWHKEILWAMAQGIHVFGSSSMGALRAAELAAFGMVGVGRIFHAYDSGAIEDDDEVAVTHASAEGGFRALSDAMVNIRETLRHAEAGGVISDKLRFALERIAKGLYYPHRSYARVFEQAAEAGLPQRELQAFREWLPGGKIDQKREDALEMLRVIKAAVQNGLPPKAVDYKLEHTTVWNSLIDSAGLHQGDGTSAGNLSVDEILAELWADPEQCLRAYQYATIRHLVHQASLATGTRIAPETIAAVEQAFRAERDITEPFAFESWLEQHHITPAEFAEVITHEAMLHESSLAPSPFPYRFVLDWLRLNGRFDTTVGSALRKKESSPEPPNWQDREVATEALMQWYAEHLAGPDGGNDAVRSLLPYLRKDWDMFLAAIVRHYQGRARAEEEATAD